MSDIAKVGALRHQSQRSPCAIYRMSADDLQSCCLLYVFCWSRHPELTFVTALLPAVYDGQRFHNWKVALLMQKQEGLHLFLISIVGVLSVQVDQTVEPVFCTELHC